MSAAVARAALRDPRLPWAFALAVALVATAGSLNFSGIGPTGWRGMGLFPCELCWYQRILMYPLPALIGIGLWTREPRLARFVLPLSVPGFLVAAFHAYIQLHPEAEPGQCYIGSCTQIDYQFMGALTIPQLSLVAFLLITLAAVAAMLRPPAAAE